MNKEIEDQFSKLIDVAVEAIILDLSDRRGLKREWYAIDADVKQEIEATWSKIIREILLGPDDPKEWLIAHGVISTQQLNDCPNCGSLLDCGCQRGSM